MTVINSALEQRIEGVRSRLTPASIQEAVRTLMREGENVGGGINAIRLIKHLLGDPNLRDVEATWAYDRLKPTLRTALGQIPSLIYFEGD